MQKANELTLSEDFTLLLYHALHRDDEENKEHREYLEQHRSEFKELFDEMIEKSEQWVVKPTAVAKLKKIMEKNYEKSSIDELSTAILSLLTFTQAGASAAFQFFGEQIDRQRYSTVTEILTGTLIYQSVTGFYEIRIDLKLEK